MVIGSDPRMKSCTRPSNEIIFCTIKGKPLVLSWERTPRLDSGVRVRAHILSENVRLPDPNQTIHEMPSGKIGVYTSKGVPKDPFPKSFEFNAKHFATLVTLPAPFHEYPEPFICLVGISRYYTLDEDAYPEFLGDNDEEIDLLSFIRTENPTKVRVAERRRVENEPRLLESTVGCVVPLLPIAPARASSKLEVSVDKLFDEGASEDGQDSSHHSGANIAEAEVDSIVRSSALAIVTITTVTAAVDADATADRVPIAPSLFGVGSSSTGRTDSVPGGFFDVSGSDFLIGGICTVVDLESDLQKVYVPQWSATNGFGLDDSRICREMLDEFALPKIFASVRGMDHDQLFTEFNVGAARQISLSTEVRMHAEYNIREKRKLRVVVDEQAELLKVRDGEIKSLKAQLLLKEAEAAEAIHLQAEIFKFEATEKSLQGEVREQEVTDLDAQVTAIKLQNDNIVDQGPRLAKSLRRACRKGHLLGLPMVRKRLQNVNFFLIAELKSNKDASVNTIMNLLRLDDALAERLGLTESHPHANQLMVSIHYSSDQRVVGAEGTFGSTHDTTTTLSVTFVSASTIPPIYTDDYEVAHADAQGVPCG
uniref:Transposase (Putative), gypsy type n=1 Tax=Tanacetum cinerariifolium TaxID=118510 RepID=A0A6L2L253_TANCI|nr:hypothetical protein [Tanacetum cinerariifolium]